MGQQQDNAGCCSSNGCAAVAELYLSLAFKLAVSGAGDVGVDAEAAREIARAGQTLAGSKFVAQDTEDNLRDRLFAQGDFAGAIESEPYAFFFQLANCSVAPGAEIPAGIGRR
jgi:hypothetical protein